MRSGLQKEDLTISVGFSVGDGFDLDAVVTTLFFLPAIAAIPVGALPLSGFGLNFTPFFCASCIPCSRFNTAMKSECFFSLLGTDFSPSLPPEPRRFSIKALRAGSKATSGGMLPGIDPLSGLPGGGGGGGGGGPPRNAPEI